MFCSIPFPPLFCLLSNLSQVFVSSKSAWFGVPIECTCIEIALDCSLSVKLELFYFLHSSYPSGVSRSSERSKIEHRLQASSESPCVRCQGMGKSNLL